MRSVIEREGLLNGVVKGIAYGFAGWTIYGVSELGLSLAVQLSQHPMMRLVEWQWHSIFALLGACAVAGIILGAISGVVLTSIRPGFFAQNPWVMPSITIVGAFLIQIARSRPVSAAEYVALAVTIVLGIAFSAAVISERWSLRIAFLAPPWIVSAMILAAPFAGRLLRSRPWIWRATLVPLAPVLIFLCALSYARVRAAGHLRRGQMAAVAGYAISMFMALQSGASIARANQVSSPRPNILLITMDTVRADHLSLYGYERETTPRLSEFARSATLYKRAIAVSDHTLPTHASIFTGLYPDWHGAMMSASAHPVRQPLRPGVVTVAEVLKSNGYWTGESAANYAFLDSSFGLTRGFGVSEISRPVHLTGAGEGLYILDAAKELLSRWTDVEDFERPYLRATDITESAQTLIDQAGASRQPFFLFLNYMDAHTPYAPGAPFDTMFPGSDPKFRPQFSLHESNAGQNALSPEQKLYIVSQYDAGIAAEDSAIDGLIRFLRDRKIYDNTLIVITGDHGEGFLEHGLLEHDLGVVYQTHVHVPLLIKYPRQHEARISDELVSQVDLMPTMLENAGITSPRGLQGRSLLHPPANPRNIVLAVGRQTINGNNLVRGTRRAIFTGSWKLVTWTFGPPELYDLASDPGEIRNLYDQNNSLVIELSKQLANFVSAIPAQKLRPSSADPAMLDRLKSLGYVQ
ncbi:MAG: sulfatase-like hydrolase/transferase [Bryobacterales bacterium]|nr:sulfatase-like hydrolase/transferase [Bryobacterales bacterium]